MTGVSQEQIEEMTYRFHENSRRLCDQLKRDLPGASWFPVTETPSFQGIEDYSPDEVTGMIGSFWVGSAELRFMLLLPLEVLNDPHEFHAGLAQHLGELLLAAFQRGKLDDLLPT